MTIIIMIFMPALSNSQSLKILTYNIRYDNPNDGESAWKNRKEMMVEFLQNQNPDLIGLQEVLLNQFEYLKSGLKDYEIIGVGRKDGKTLGEFSPILFKKDKLELLSYETVWLSETPNIPGVGWDAALERIATIAHLQLKENRNDLIVINTHYDHQGENARLESSRLLLNIINERYSEYSTILMGDLNAEPLSEPVATFTPELIDTFKCKERSGPDLTFAGFEDNQYSEGPRIDYIFLKDLNCTSFSILTPKVGVRNLSDHLPLTATISF